MSPTHTKRVLTVYGDEGWPGSSSWMDYLNPDARDYYFGLYLYQNWSRTTPTLGGVCWNDMNEASVSDNDTKKTFPYDLVHYGGVSNRAIHNTYNLLQIMATHKGLEDSDNSTRRPFILTRAHFAGTQRYAASWTGDNTVEFCYIPISYSTFSTSQRKSSCKDLSSPGLGCGFSESILI
ncbi:hypothetical protein MTP99_005971 [Tenebrio molitor]|nr:hypothetical protein MTP99_005971 [Tenebrio molitor]